MGSKGVTVTKFLQFLMIMELYLELQTGDMKHCPGNRIEGATGCQSWCRPLRPLFHFLDDVSYPQSVEKEKAGHFRAKRRVKVLVEWPVTEGGREGGKERNERTGAMRAMRVSNGGKISILPRFRGTAL